MKHGSANTYLRQGCRCEPCKAAEAARKRRSRGKQPEVYPRHRSRTQWPLDAIVAVVPDARDRLEIDSTVWNRCVRTGLSDRTADHWCVRLGYHPVSVFGWEWITRGMHPLDELFVYGSDTAEPGWRQAALVDEQSYPCYSEPVTEMTPALRQQPGVRPTPQEGADMNDLTRAVNDVHSRAS